MRSVMNVAISKPQQVPEGVLIYVGITMSEDADGPGLPAPAFAHFQTLVTHEAIARGPAQIKKSCMGALATQRFEYSYLAYQKLVAELDGYFDRTDLSKFNTGWFEDPVSQTRH